MKKRIAALMALLALLLSLCGCGKADLYGEWKQTSPKLDGKQPVLRLYDNDTGTVTNEDGETTLTFSVKKDVMTVKINEVGAEETAYTFEIKDDTLTLTDEDGYEVKFKRINDD